MYSTLPVQIVYTVQVLPGIVQCQCSYCALYMYCQVLCNVSADIVHCSGIARYCTMKVQILYTVQVLPGIVQCQCRYCTLYRYCQTLYNDIADNWYCTGIARYCRVPLQILYTVQILPWIIQCHFRYCILYRYCQELHDASADIVLCSGIARYCTHNCGSGQSILLQASFKIMALESGLLPSALGSSSNQLQLFASPSFRFLFQPSSTWTILPLPLLTMGATGGRE